MKLVKRIKSLFKTKSTRTKVSSWVLTMTEKGFFDTLVRLELARHGEYILQHSRPRCPKK